ncbi:MAG: hypothetical protein ABW058_02405 [Methylobacterium sp.]
MRVTSLAVVLGLAAAGPALAQGGGGTVPVCENLVALRQWSAGAGDDPVRAAAQAEKPPGCRLVARETLGAVERRSTFGGAIYECLAQAGGACVWVMP